MALFLNHQVEDPALLTAAQLICVAARTAPKGKGKDLLVTAVVSGDEKSALSARMRKIAEAQEIHIFNRDADNLDAVQLLVLIGTKKQPLGVPYCGFCGFTDCQAMLEAGGSCSFNVGDLGIALGSAASRAADLRFDNRIMFTAGKAALELGILGPEVEVAYGIPLSASGKSPFFDRG